MLWLKKDIFGLCCMKNILAESTPIVEGISDDFNPNHLSFPIHAGALRYLHKDEPSFLERYAEILGVIISIVIAIIGGVAGLFRLFRQKRKNRVDKFYMELQEVEKKLNNNYEPKLALKEIESTKQRAMKKLVDEKLAPNESFNIFLNMYNNMYQKIHH